MRIGHILDLVLVGALAAFAVWVWRQGPGMDSRALDAMHMGGMPEQGWLISSDDSLRMDWLDEALLAADARSLLVSQSCGPDFVREAYTAATPFAGSAAPSSVAYVRDAGNYQRSAKALANERDVPKTRTAVAADLWARVPACAASRADAHVESLAVAIQRLNSASGADSLEAIQVSLGGLTFELTPDAPVLSTKEWSSSHRTLELQPGAPTRPSLGWSGTQRVAETSDLDAQFLAVTSALEAQGLRTVANLARFAEQPSGWGATMRSWTYLVAPKVALNVIAVRTPSPGWTTSGGRFVLSLSSI